MAWDVFFYFEVTPLFTPHPDIPRQLFIQSNHQTPTRLSDFSLASLVHFVFILACFDWTLQSSEVLSSQLAALASEKVELVQSLSKVQAELVVRGEELERVQTSLATERESGVKTAEALQNQLNEKVKSISKWHKKVSYSGIRFPTDWL